MYIRKTSDEWIIQGLYNGTWEDETTETKRRDGIERLKEYRSNMPQYAHRIIKHRVKIQV